MARKIGKIILHCSDSDVMKHNDISIIRQWHLARGFKNVGYHYFIQKMGTVQHGRKLHIEGAHVKGHNKDSIGICLSGRKEFTHDQFRSLARIIKELAGKYKLSEGFIFGHNDFTDQKTCPNFDVQEFLNRFLPASKEDGKGTYKISKPAAAGSKKVSETKLD